MYISGAYPKKQNNNITINSNITFTVIFDKLINVGIVDTGNLILVTK